MRKFTVLLAGAMLMLGMATAAQAIPTQITGSIDFSGTELLSKSSAGTVTIANAQTVTFINTVTDFVKTLDGTGDFAAIPVGTKVTMASPITFAPVAPNLITPLWNITFGSPTETFSFDLTSLMDVTRTLPTATKRSGEIELSGSGILHATGFLDTIGFWDLTIPSSTGVANIKLSFSENTQAAPVPEPGTMMLLGAGFLGLAVYGKRRKNA